MTEKSIRGLPKEERDEIRRNQIVDAAARCVAVHGFHKATLQLIARKAGMSVGQIYRYFSGKEKIVEAIVIKLADEYTDWIDMTESSPDLAERMLELMVDFSEEYRHRRALLLEIHAESTRNPVVADILRASDELIRTKARKALGTGRPDLNQDRIVAIVEFMAALREGRFLRMDKISPEDLAGFKDLYRQVAHSLYGGNVSYD